MIGEGTDSLDTNSTDTPDAGPTPQLGLPLPLARDGTQQKLLSIPFTVEALAAQGRHNTGLSSHSSSACSGDMHCGLDADRAPSGGPPVGKGPAEMGPLGRKPIESVPFSKAPMGRALIDRAPEDRASSNRAQMMHFPKQIEEVDDTRREQRREEQYSVTEPAATAAEVDDDQVSEQSGVFDASLASKRHIDVVQATPQQLHGVAVAQQAVTSAGEGYQPNTASSPAASAAVMTEEERFQPASDLVGEAEGHTAGSTKALAGRCTKAKKAKYKSRASKSRAPSQGTKEPGQKGGDKSASRATGLPKGHCGTAPQPSPLRTAHTAGKLHHGRASDDCQPSCERRSAKAWRSGLLDSDVAPLGMPRASVPSAAMHVLMAAALFPRLAVKEGTAVQRTAGFEPAPATSAPAAAPSRLPAGASPRAAAAFFKAPASFPRAAAQSPKSSATHWPTAKAPFLSPRTAAQSPRSSQNQQPVAKSHSLSPRATAASSSMSPRSPRATARSPRSPPTHLPEVRGRPPFVSTTRSGIPEPSSACPLPPNSPRSPRPASLPPKRMDTDPSVVAQTQLSDTSGQAVLDDEAQPVVLLDTNSNAVPASLHTNGLARGDNRSSGVVTKPGVQRGTLGSLRAHQEVTKGLLGGCEAITKGSCEGRPKAAPSKLYATSNIAGSVSDKPAKTNHNSCKQQERMFHISAQHQPAQEASQRQLGSEAFGSSLDTAHTHGQPRPKNSSQPPPQESLLQLTVDDKHSSDGRLSSESEDDGASSMSGMSNGPYGQSGVGVWGRKAGTSAWNQFPQQPDSVGSIAQLFMMRMRARAVLQVSRRHCY